MTVIAVARGLEFAESGIGLVRSKLALKLRCSSCGRMRMIQFSASAAVEAASTNVRVNVVVPGVIDTEMSSFVRSNEGRDYTLGIQALPRIGQADDVADVISFLASDAARWVTGDTLQVGGGSKI